MYQPAQQKPVLTIQQTRPAIAAKVPAAKVPTISVKTAKPQPVKLMSADHRPDVVFDAIRIDERAWGMRACVLTRVENLINARYDHEELMKLWTMLDGLWSRAYLKYPNIPIIAAAVRLSGLTPKQYAAKHPNLLWEIYCCWEWDTDDEPIDVPNIEISPEAARIMRYTNLMIRMIEKSRAKKSKKYQRLSRMAETLHYRQEIA